MKPYDDYPGNIPPGAVRAGNSWLYPDSQGGTHSTLGDAIQENQRIEGDQSRGASGGCGQDSSNVPPGPPRPQR